MSLSLRIFEQHSHAGSERRYQRHPLRELQGSNHPGTDDKIAEGERVIFQYFYNTTIYKFILTSCQWVAWHSKLTTSGLIFEHANQLQGVGVQQPVRAEMRFSRFLFNLCLLSYLAIKREFGLFRFSRQEDKKAMYGIGHLPSYEEAQKYEVANFSGGDCTVRSCLV